MGCIKPHGWQRRVTAGAWACTLESLELDRRTQLQGPYPQLRHNLLLDCDHEDLTWSVSLYPRQDASRLLQWLFETMSGSSSARLWLQHCN